MNFYGSIPQMLNNLCPELTASGANQSERHLLISILHHLNIGSSHHGVTGLLPGTDTMEQHPQTLTWRMHGF